MSRQGNGMRERQKQERSKRWKSSVKDLNWLLLARLSSNYGTLYICVLLCLVPPFLFQLICVFKNSSPPTTSCQQNILTYPTLNIVQCPSLMTKMTTNAGTVVEIWNPSVKQLRQEDIDHSMNLKGQEELLIHFSVCCTLSWPHETHQ